MKYGGLKFLEAAHIKDLLAVLRWADNPRNTLAAFRDLQLLPGMGPGNARRALDHFEANGGSFGSLQSFTPPSGTRSGLAQAGRAARWRSPTRSARGRDRCIWHANGIARTSSGYTSTSTRASAISTSSRCSRASIPPASAS